jgi:copper(I)-binding protein
MFRIAYEETDMFQFNKLAAAAAIAAMTMAPAIAGDVKAGNLMLSDIRARATLPGAPVAGGYLKITNTGDDDDQLTGGTAAFAAKVEVHEMKMENEVMKMREIQGGLEIPAGGSVELKPGGFHIMFMKLNTQLKEGESRSVVLEFEKAGKVTVDFNVVDLRKTRSHSGHGEKKMGDKMKTDTGHGSHKSD